MVPLYLTCNLALKLKFWSTIQNAQLNHFKQKQMQIFYFRSWVGRFKIFVHIMRRALCWYSMFTLYKLFVYYAKIDKYWIYEDELTGGIILLNKKALTLYLLPFVIPLFWRILNLIKIKQKTNKSLACVWLRSTFAH